MKKHALKTLHETVPATGIESLFALVIVILGIAIALFVYFLPARLAARKEHPHKTAIFWCNLFFGSTGVGWLICLIWSMNPPAEIQPSE